MPGIKALGRKGMMVLWTFKEQPGAFLAEMSLCTPKYFLMTQQIMLLTY